MPYDPELATLMRSALEGRAGVTEKRMFGGICWLLNGNMLCGVETGRFMFRVGKEREAEALARPGAEVIAFNGRRMGGLIWVDAAACGGARLGEWIALAEDHVGELPAK